MMREIIHRPAFLRDVKRLKRKHHDMDALKAAIRAVAERQYDWLGRHRDHHLTGSLRGYRELHIEADRLFSAPSTSMGLLHSSAPAAMTNSSDKP